MDARTLTAMAAADLWQAPGGQGDSVALNRLAFTATLHCLTGCAIGEVLGMSLGAALHWPNLQTVAVPCCWPSCSATP